MRVGDMLTAGTDVIWRVEGLPLAVYWPGPAMPLFLISYPWPGDDSGVRELVSTALYTAQGAADAAARYYIGRLPE